MKEVFSMQKVTPFFSIIIPVYNAKKLLPIMLDSINAQSYGNYEVIIIDDCSEDCILDIAKNYSTKDARISFLRLAKNGGVSNARNEGIKLATGKYSLFWDADDWVDSECLKTYYRYLSDESVECLITGAIEEYKDHNVELVPSFNDIQKKASLVPILMDLEKKALVGYCWNKVFKTEVIKKYNIQFREMPMNEDFEFTLDFLDHVNNVVVVDRAFYHYRLDQSSSLTKRYVEEFYEIHRKKIQDYLNYINNNNPNYFDVSLETLRPIYLRYILSSVARTFSQNSSFNNQTRQKYVERIFQDDLFRIMRLNKDKIYSNTEIIYWPVIKRKVNLTIMYARVVVFVQSNMGSLFSRIKQIR